MRPAVAQADVGLAMNSGTSACKEAANMVDLDSDPTKLIEVIAIGKQLLITRGAITTFSIANDVAKYFAILPAMFSVAYPQLNSLNIMSLARPESAILSAVIFNALIIIILVPLSIRGVAYRAAPAAELLRRNLLIYGVGGILRPVSGNQADRRHHHVDSPRLGATNDAHVPPHPALAGDRPPRAPDRDHRVRVPGRGHRHGSGRVSHAGQRLVPRRRREDGGLVADRAILRRADRTSGVVRPPPA